MKAAIERYEVYIRGLCYGTLDVAEDGMHRWVTDPSMREKAGTLFSGMLLTPVKEKEWQKPISFFETKIAGAKRNGLAEVGNVFGGFSDGVHMKRVK